MLSKNEILFKILTTLFTFFYITNVILCDPTQEDPCPAKILPTEEINLVENDTLLVYCQLTNVTPRCNSKHLSFDADERRRYTRIVNESTIELKIPNAKAMEKFFICKYKNVTGLMPFSVQVGYKPSKVNLICTSKNFASLSCRADLPPNTVTVHYTAVYWPSTPSHQQTYSLQITNCTEEFRINKTCTVAMFRKFWNYTFEISGTNKLGSFTQRETFDIKTIVIPNKPIDVIATNITSRSANLTWSLPYTFEVFRGNFIHRITLQMSKDINGLGNKQDINVDTSNVKKINALKFNLELTNLEYAHTWYNVQIFYRVANALYGDQQWSEHSACVFQTTARKPDTPPEASPYAFYPLEQNETIIYWKELPSVKHNGPDLVYKIFEVSENGRTIKKEPKGPYSKTTARFGNINPNNDYEFKLIAENSIGPSENYSIIRIPSLHHRIQKPINLKKILSQSIYNLTWEYPSKYVPDSYTIFRCDPVDEQESLCDHLIDFDQIDGRETQYIYNNTIEKNTKIFAITANRNENSSGMSWFPCSATINSDMTKFPAWLEVAGTQKIKVSWLLRCDTTPLLQGFNISYCAIIGDPIEGKCTPDGEFHLFANEKHNETTITNLTAYTTYRVKISMFNGKETGPAVILQNTTASGVPTPPTDLTMLDVTNSSISLGWNPPASWNGKDQSYKIVYTTPDNELFVRTVERVLDQYLPTNYTIDKLASFTFYTIKIAGCNPACSNYSNEIMIKTKTGKPKQLQSVTNEGDIIRPIYKWSPPESAYRGGNLDFYEFKIGIKINGKYLQNPRIIILNGTQCTLRSKVCNENVEQYNVSVRAVNKVKRDVPLAYYSRAHGSSQTDKSLQISCIEELNYNYYYDCNTDFDCIAGDWRDGIISECLYDSETFRFYLILFVGFSIGFGILVGVVIGMKKFHKMRDIGVELPEGLEDIDKVKPPIDNSKPDKMDNNKLDDEQTMRLIATDNKSASSFSLERKSQSSEFIDSDNEHTLNEDSASNSPIYDEMDSNDNLKYDNDSCSSKKNIDVIQNPQSIIQVMNPINNIPQSLPIMSNGYVSNAFLAPSSNGYVQHSALMNMNIPLASNGYTSIAALMNQNKQVANRAEPPKQQQDTTNNIKTPIVTSTNGISGYVTHKQLSDFHNTLMQ